jgi:cell division protein FtsB
MAHAPHQPNVRRRSGGDFLPVATRVIWSLIVAAGLVFLGLTFYPEWSRLGSMKRELEAEQTRLSELKRKCAEQEQEARLLQTDPQYLEIIARDKLDMMKDGETIFRLNNSQPRS